MQLREPVLELKKVSLADLIAWLPVMFYLANLYRMAGHSPIFYYLTAVAAGIPGLIRAFFIKGKMWTPAVILIGTIFITGCFNYLLVGNLSIADVALEVLFAGMALTMLLFRPSFIQGAVCFYGTAALFVAAALRGRNPILVLESSRNYISVVLVLACAIYYCAVENTGRPLNIIDLIPAGLSFLLSVWAYGRGGILTCAIMLAMVVFCWAFCYTDGDARKQALVFGALIAAIFFLIFVNFNLIEKFMSLGRWADRGGYSNDRMNIWGDYIAKSGENIIYVLFGAPLEDISIIQKFGGNTHNSFIQLHAFNGIVAFVAFFIVAAKSFFFEIKNRYYLHAIMMFTVMLRGMTDKFIFGQYGMPILLYLIIYPYFIKDKMLQEEQYEHL